MSTYDDKVGLAKPEGGVDDDWAAEINQNWDALGDVLAPTTVFHVSPAFAAGSIPTLAAATDRRHFDTIQAALNAVKAASLGQNGGLVLVYPGTYNEKLVIDDHSVAVVGIGAGVGFYQGAPVVIRGSGSAEPTIQITSPNAAIARVTLANLAIENGYAASNATEIDDAYAIRAADIGGGESYGGSQNGLSILNCAIRCQTWGLNNKWHYGIRTVGWWDTHLFNVQLQGLQYGGGANTGYIRKLISVEGNVTLSKHNNLRCKGCTFDTNGTGATLYTVEYGNNAAVLIHRSTANQTSVAAKTTVGAGTNTHRGFADSSETDAMHFNRFGIGATIAY